MSMPKAGLRKFAVKLGPYIVSFLFFFPVGDEESIQP